MNKPTYSLEQVEAASAAAIKDTFGESSRISSVVAGTIAGKLLTGQYAEVLPNEEAFDYSKSPDYTMRAIRTNSAKELHGLLADAANRLSLSIADYNNRNRRNKDGSGNIKLTPWLFEEGARVGQAPLQGQLIMFVDNLVTVDQKPQGHRFSDDSIASVRLIGGEDAPYDVLANNATRTRDLHVERSLDIRRKWIKDPVSGQEIPLLYAQKEQRFVNAGSSYDDGLVYSDEKHKNALNMYGQGELITTAIFWALDSAIRYYEEVYITGNKHVGLTYADYRDAGCVHEDGDIDYEKVWPYVEKNRYNSLVPVEEDHYPRLGDPEQKVLTTPPEHRKAYEGYKHLIKIGQDSLLGVR